MTNLFPQDSVLSEQMLHRFPAPRPAASSAERGGEPFDVSQGREPVERLVEPGNTSSYLRIEALSHWAAAHDAPAPGRQIALAAQTQPECYSAYS